MANDQTKTPNPNTAVEAFNEFCNAFKQEQSYVLTKNIEVLFTKENVEKAYNIFSNNSKNKKFDDVIQTIISKIKDKENKENIIDIINHAVWLWALPNSRKTSWVLPKGENNKINEDFKERYKDALLKIKGVAGGGSGYVQTKTNGVRFILYLYNELKNNSDTEDFKNKIEKIITDITKNTEKKYDDKKYPIPDGVKNLLLYLCKPEEYEPIAATDDKEKIVKTFGNLAETSEEIDKKIKSIKGKLSIENFYQGNLPLLWKGEGVNNLSREQLLEYKKAIVLYGPPGTGKTYTAKELAKSILVRHHFKQKKNNSLQSEEIIKILKNKYDDRIYYLQFHINYNYEDFIAGQTIVDDGKVETKKGFIFEIIEKAKQAQEKAKQAQQAQENAKLEAIKPEPFVVILDEMNRTDISRVFGELFTAIEKRGEDVYLPLPAPKGKAKKSTKKLILNVPDNIYFIGTMNEIDFSLERIDFALRRRFIWELHDYCEDSLESLINYKKDKIIKEDQYKSKIQENLDAYCNACTALNKKIENKMNETYHIGHTFFAEVVDIYKNLIESNKSISKPWKKAKRILWQISIKPTLDAYCGTMPNEEKKSVMKDFEKAFFTNDENTSETNDDITNNSPDDEVNS